MNAFLKDEGGQAIVEYVVMLGVTVTIVGTLAQGLRAIILVLWQTMTCDISAACPTCPPAEEIRNKIANGCAN
ncbi:MAG: hypothetical protein IT285_07080 [Bdellovibrionales bacterium]|nr:hypothetical protein [Bdellovibrionales bacterium]